MIDGTRRLMRVTSGTSSSLSDPTRQSLAEGRRILERGQQHRAELGHAVRGRTISVARLVRDEVRLGQIACRLLKRPGRGGGWRRYDDDRRSNEGDRGQGFRTIRNSQ